MKILFLTTWYPDVHNANHGIFVQDQALTMSRDHEVRVVAARIDYNLFGFSKLTKRVTTNQKIQEVRLVISKSLPVFNQLNFFIRTFWETYKVAKQFRPDIIHGNIGYPGGFWSWLVSKAIGIPYVITEHTRITNNFRSFIHKHLALFSFQRANGIISVSHSHAAELKKYIQKEIQVIPNVINFSKFDNVAILPPGRPVQIGFLGSMNTPVKGLDILLQALAKVHLGFMLHIGGEGVLSREYKLLSRTFSIENKCIFHGFISHDEVPGFMGRIHFLISASRSETFGITMVEALACGLPVLATDSGGPRDFINQTNGIIVPCENIYALQEGLQQMIVGFDKYDCDKIKKEVRQKFSSDNFIQAVNRVYSNCVSAK